MNRIKELRLNYGWLQSDLAEKINTKPQTVSRYEKGDRGLDVETIEKLCDIFDVTADYLLGRSNVPRFDLSDEEASLLAAFRQADEDHRELVRLALKQWADKTKQKEAAS